MAGRCCLLLLKLCLLLALASAASVVAEEPITDNDRSHWSFQPVTRPDIPQVDDDGWSRTDIDRFIFARLAQRGLQPMPPADPLTLLRRVTFDLTGLPPTPDEIAVFLADTSDKAWDRLVDRLLDSPVYGERWGMHWLDLARFRRDRRFRTRQRPPQCLALPRLGRRLPQCRHALRRVLASATRRG